MPSKCQANCHTSSMVGGPRCVKDYEPWHMPNWWLSFVRRSATCGIHKLNFRLNSDINLNSTLKINPNKGGTKNPPVSAHVIKCSPLNSQACLSLSSRSSLWLGVYSWLQTKWELKWLPQKKRPIPEKIWSIRRRLKLSWITCRRVLVCISTAQSMMHVSPNYFQLWRLVMCVRRLITLQARHHSRPGRNRNNVPQTQRGRYKIPLLTDLLTDWPRLYSPASWIELVTSSLESLLPLPKAQTSECM